MVMTMDDEVDELCKKAVTTTPITRPQTGLDNNLLLANAFPAVRPVRKKMDKDLMSPYI